MRTESVGNSLRIKKQNRPKAALSIVWEHPRISGEGGEISDISKSPVRRKTLHTTEIILHFSHFYSMCINNLIREPFSNPSNSQASQAISKK